MGGISFPLLADFHPKGAMAESFGLYLAGSGAAWLDDVSPADRRRCGREPGSASQEAHDVLACGELLPEALAVHLVTHLESQHHRNLAALRALASETQLVLVLTHRLRGGHP